MVLFQIYQRRSLTYTATLDPIDMDVKVDRVALFGYTGHNKARPALETGGSSFR